MLSKSVGDSFQKGGELPTADLGTFLWKYFENAFPNVRSDFQNLLLGIIKLQKIVASQENQHITCCYYLLLSSCKVVTKDHSIAEPCVLLSCNHLAKLLQKIIASQKNQHIASHATIFCNHLAKLLQKIVASQENQYITCCYYLFVIILQSLCPPNDLISRDKR
jgi:hypothetical protein